MPVCGEARWRSSCIGGRSFQGSGSTRPTTGSRRKSETSRTATRLVDKSDKKDSGRSRRRPPKPSYARPRGRPCGRHQPFASCFVDAHVQVIFWALESARSADDAGRPAAGFIVANKRLCRRDHNVVTRAGCPASVPRLAFSRFDGEVVVRPLTSGVMAYRFPLIKTFTFFGRAVLVACAEAPTTDAAASRARTHNIPLRIVTGISVASLSAFSSLREGARDAACAVTFLAGPRRKRRGPAEHRLDHALLVVALGDDHDAVGQVSGVPPRRQCNSWPRLYPAHLEELKRRHIGRERLHEIAAYERPSRRRDARHLAQRRAQHLADARCA